MSNRLKFERAGQALLILGTVALTGTACQDLHVENTIDPDRDRATANPSDVEALIGSGFFPNLYRPIQGSDGGLSGLVVSLWANQASDFTATLAGTTSAVWYLDLREPRPPLENASSICSTICQHGPRDYWARIGRANSIAYDGLVILDEGMQLTEGGVDVTPRARAFAKLMQGWSWGYAALVFDQINVVPESIDISQLTLPEIQALNLSSLQPYDEAIESAVGAIEEAIQIAQANPDVVNFPSFTESALWFGTPEPISNAQFIQVANTLAARLLVLNARTPAEREAVDWQRVLGFTANGIQPGNDLGFQLTTQRVSQVLARQQNNSPIGTTNARWDYRTIGPADQSGAYQSWINSPVDARTRFDIETPDRRITGSTPASNGTYTSYRTDNNGFLAERGLYLFSAYQWTRHIFENNLTAANRHNAGIHRIVSADENTLLRAEALYHTGNMQGAVDAINVTRTREHMGQSLPPLTTAGVPEVGGACVPRTDTGECGTVLTALRYERMIELAGMDAIRGFADSRGFGLLPEGTPLSAPVPGNVLELYGLDIYTYGGVGDSHSAVYAPVN